MAALYCWLTTMCWWGHVTMQLSSRWRLMNLMTLMLMSKITNHCGWHHINKKISLYLKNSCLVDLVFIRVVSLNRRPPISSWIYLIRTLNPWWCCAKKNNRISKKPSTFFFIYVMLPVLYVSGTCVCVWLSYTL